MKISVGQFGGRMYYGIPSILYKNGMLSRFYTDFVANKFPYSLLNSIPSFSKKLNSRVCPIDGQKISQLPLTSLISQWGSKNKTNIALQEEYLRLGKRLENSIIKDKFNNADAIFMLGSSCSTVFERARAKGIYTIKEQSGAPAQFVKSILQSEWNTYKDWEDCENEKSVFDFWVNHTEDEYKNCDLLICPSQYVLDAATSIKPDIKTALIPFGVPIVNKQTSPKTYNSKRKLKVLTVGRISLAKGSHYILEAAKELSENCEFNLVGGVHFNKNIVEKYKKYVNFTGHIPRADLKTYYEQADVFLLPSLSEGSATVCYEALAYGLPLIVTFNSGQFIENGKQGFIVDTKSTKSIVDAINKILELPELVEKMSKNALELASFGSFQAYEERIVHLLKTIEL